MKLSELRLDTVYADREGRPLIVLSLDKFLKPKAHYGYGTRRIRAAGQLDKSFGVVTLRHAYASRPIDIPDLQKVARELTSIPETEQMLGEYDVSVEVLRNIVEPWEDHLVREHAEATRRRAAAEQAKQEHQARAEQVARIIDLLPEGVNPLGLSAHSKYAQLRLNDLEQILTAAAPVALVPGAAFTPREMSLLAAGFDAAIASLCHEDGSPVDVVSVKNPYRS